MGDTFAMLQQGGWPMVPIAFCSVAALAIIVERAIALRRALVINPAVLDLVNGLDDPARADSVLVACRKEQGAFARLCEAVLEGRKREPAHVIETLNAAGRIQVGGLERGLTVLEIIAAITPLLGLLGTVLGMVSVFEAISMQGTGDPRVLSAGISKALVTTIAGLSVAIPSLAFHSWFSRRVEQYADEMHERAVGLLARIGAGPDAAGPRSMEI